MTSSLETGTAHRDPDTQSAGEEGALEGALIALRTERAHVRYGDLSRGVSSKGLVIGGSE